MCLCADVRTNLKQWDNGIKFSKVHLTKEQQQSKYPNADIKNGMSTHASRLRDTAKKKLNSVAIGKF